MKQSYTYSLAPKQFVTAAIINSRTASPRPYRVAIFLGSVLFFGALGFLAQQGLAGRTVASIHVLWAVIAAIAGFFAMNGATVAGMRSSLARSTYHLSARTMDIETDGLRFTSADTQSLHRWDGIAGARIAHDTVHLRIDPVTFIPVPVATFESPAEAEAFVAMVNTRAKEAAAKPAADAVSAIPVAGMEQAPIPPATAAPPSHVRRAGAVIVDALRLSFFLPMREGRPTGSWKTVLGLVVIGVLLPTAFGFVRAGLDGQWNEWAVPGAFMHVALLLLASIVASLAIGRTSEVPRLFAAGLSIEILVDFVQYLAYFLAGPGASQVLALIYGFATPWTILALAVFAARQVEPGLRRLGTIVSCCVILVPLATAYRDRVMWTPLADPADAAPARDRVSPANEEVFYKQPELLAQSLEAIRPGKKGVIDVFFVAFGGYGNEDVFRREVDATTKLMAERFGAGGHSIRLINNRATLHDLPIASKTSLRAALTRIASVMDKDEDVLVLFMTSHGSEKHRFSLQLWPLNFEDVDPAVLRSLLDDSGIRNRVVIVSACYSGGFVKPLEDPDTLVITAAAADKTSFGCSNEAEWTYFGRAYFDDGLRNTHSFTKAFEIAQPLIVEREAKVRADKSEPQMFVGANIAPRLAALEAQLDGKGTSALAASPRPEVQADRLSRYMAAYFNDAFLDDLLRTCRFSMESNGPDAYARRNPAAYEGMDKSPKHWRRVQAAWDRYALEYCNATSSRQVLRGIYEARTRQIMSAGSLDAANAFFATEPGARWLGEERKVALAADIEMIRMQDDVGAPLFQKYSQELGAVLIDYNKK